MKDFFLTAASIVLALIPLQFVLPSSIFQGAVSRLWDAGELFLFFVLLIFYLRNLVSQKRSVSLPGLYLSIWLSVIVAVAVVTAAAPSLQLEVWRWLLIIWTIPFFFYLYTHYEKKVLLMLMITIITFHGLWGVTHFVTQHDFNLYLIGETQLATDKPGIAKFALPFGTPPTKLIRAYGPYPHPNILGAAAALGFTAATFLAQRRRSHVLTILQYVLLLSILSTFSRSAVLAVSITVVLMLVHNYSKLKVFNRSILKKWGILILTLIVFIPLWWARQLDQEDLAIPERLQGITWAREIVVNYQFRGVGIGRYPEILEDHLVSTKQSYAPWQIAPVHSAPLLFIAEWGAIASLALLLTAIYGLSRLPVKRVVWLIPLVPLLLFDHYLVTATAPVMWLAWWWLAVARPALKPTALRAPD